MSDTIPDPTPKPRKRWLMPLLFISLALNLLVVGAVVGRSMSDGWHHGHEHGGPARSLIGEPFIRALNKEDRIALLADLKKDGPRIRESRKSLRTRFEAFLTAIRAEPFQAGEVRRLMEAQQEVARGRQELGQVLLLRRLEAMTPEGRAAYADRLEKSLKRLKRR